LSAAGSTCGISGGNNPYLWQHRDRTDPLRYGLTTYFARLHDRLGLFDRLSEDGGFGAYSYEIDGVTVSRDLLDSVAELTFLEDEIGISARQVTILDIGAGYGRLAHRATTAFAGVSYLCTDGVPVSTFLSRYYLSFRGVDDRAKVIPLDEVGKELADRHVDMAVNVHSFSECPMHAIEWWLDLVARSGIEYLFVAPNRIRGRSELLSKEPDGKRLDFRPLIENRDYALVGTRSKYKDSPFMQMHGIFPTSYFLFRRRR